MRIFAIADLHLSFSCENKNMDIYGGQWIDHWQRVMKNWDGIVESNDVIIIPGDISWALKFEDAVKDLEWIHERPGKKVLIKGNHDLWWQSVSKLNSLYDDMYFLQNDFFTAGEYAICGTRGWICPGDREFSEHDLKIYRREILRLKASFEKAEKAGFKKFIGVLHYPPTNEKHEESGFTEIFKEYAAETVVYGHLHGEEVCKKGLKGIYKDTDYILTSLDYLRCIPILIRTGRCLK